MRDTSLSEIIIEEAGSDFQKWDEYVLNHSKSSFFHLGGWGRVVEKTFKYPRYSYVASRNNRICGVLPLYLVRLLPLGHALLSVPLSVYGGICADDDETEAALLNYAFLLARKMNVRYLELRNEKPLDGMPVKDLYVSFRKEIFPDRDKNMASIPRKQRRMVRQGEKHKLVSQIGGKEFLSDFYEIYAHSVWNLGTPVYPIQLFNNMLDEFGSSCRILGVFRLNKMVAGVLTFFFQDQIIPYYGGALREEFRYAVNDFMYWSLLSYGAEQGYKIFDFGRSKKGSGSYDFKRHWGFESKPLAYQYHLVSQNVMPDFSPNNPNFSLVIQAWRRMPFWLTKRLGPMIVRFFP